METQKSFQSPQAPPFKVALPAMLGADHYAVSARPMNASHHRRPFEAPNQKAQPQSTVRRLCWKGEVHRAQSKATNHAEVLICRVHAGRNPMATSAQGCGRPG